LTYQLHQGEALSYLRTLADASVDAIITDPPYSSGGLYTGQRQQSPVKKYVTTGTQRDYRTFSGDNRDQRSWTLWMTLWLTEALRVAKPGSPVVLFTDWRQLPSTTDAMQMAGATWRGIVPWCKPAGRPSGPGRFRNGAEYAVWGSKGDMPPRAEIGYLPGYHVESVRQSDKHHVTGKPTALMRTLVKVCPPGGVILDPFAGSGTTGVAALLEGRQFIGAELDATNYDIAMQRLAEVTHHEGNEPHEPAAQNRRGHAGCAAARGAGRHRLAASSHRRVVVAPSKRASAGHRGAV
jgi:site-specific DNA-methyltransferase (adenine-specific)